MLKEGITLPPTHENMPHSDPNSIPLGVKLTDEVLANELSFKIVSLILRAAGASAESIRTDKCRRFSFHLAPSNNQLKRHLLSLKLLGKLLFKKCKTPFRQSASHL
jgi:hypothetical protein